MGTYWILLFVFCGLLGDGAASPAGYIIGGKASKVGSWPWQALLQIDGKYSCGAVLVTDIALLTAAHCLQSAAGDMSRVTIRLGVHDIYDDSKGQPELYQVASSAKAPDDEDIAVLVLTTSVSKDNSFIKPITLPADAGVEYSGQDCWATGWGYNSDLVVQDVLQEAQVDVLSFDNCREKYGRVIESSFVCAIDIQNEDKGICLVSCKRGLSVKSHLVAEHGIKGICLGDSGGPLSCQVDGEWYVAGVASWTFGLCATHLPSIFVRVSDYVDWIHTIL